MKSKGVYLLVSNPKVGKSMLALQLSCSVINGTPFLGYKVNSSPVLYVTTESDEIQLKECLEFMDVFTKKLVSKRILSKHYKYFLIIL